MLFPPEKTPHYGHREERRGDVQQSNPRQAVPIVCGATADPQETYTFTPPNPSLMGAA